MYPFYFTSLIISELYEGNIEQAQKYNATLNSLLVDAVYTKHSGQVVLVENDDEGRNGNCNDSFTSVDEIESTMYGKRQA